MTRVAIDTSALLFVGEDFARTDIGRA